MAPKILHILSQRPSRTGSGVTLDAICRLAERSGWEQRAVVGVPADESEPGVGKLPADRIHPVCFAPGDGKDRAGHPAADLDFFVPGMSDVMPYSSTIWSTMTSVQLDAYRSCWRRHLGTIIDRYRPDLIHTNHIWLVSALLPDLAPGIPLTATCHATGLRQMDLCPHLRDEVVAGCRRIDRFCVLRHDHREQLADTLAIDADRVTVTGVGFQEEVFFQGDSAGNKERRGSLLYVGKYSNAKGLPWLLDAVEKLAVRRPNLRLHVAGSGAGAEADGLRERMDALAPLVIRHGQLGQEDLAALMRRCAVCVLPSFYEGVPLVLVEAAACGCRLVSTALPGVVEQIVPGFGAELALVPLPRLRNVDRPVAADLPRFTAALGQALALSLDRTEKASTLDLGPFTWGAVFKRVEAVWKQLL